MGKSKFKANIKREARLTTKKARRDTFGSKSDEENARYFDDIYTGTSSIYKLDTEARTKLDYKDRERHCWSVVAVKSNKQINQVCSTKAYRLALLWSIYYAKKYWANDERAAKKVEAIKEALPRIKGKRGDHSRHRCGIDWCCNPGHIIIGGRKDNERDKHFHYFLNHYNEEVREGFRTTFKRLCT